MHKLCESFWKQIFTGVKRILHIKETQVKIKCIFKVLLTGIVTSTLLYLETETSQTEAENWIQDWTWLEKWVWQLLPLRMKHPQEHELCASWVQSLVITRAILFNDLRYSWVVCTSHVSLYDSLYSFCLHHHPKTPPSFSLTLLLLPTYSSFHLSVSLHVNYHLPPSFPSSGTAHPLLHLHLHLTTFSPLLPMLPSLPSMHAKLPHVHLLSPLFLSIHFTDCHSLPLAFAFLCFVCFCILSLLLKPYYMYFIFLQVFLPFTTSVSSFSSSFTSSHTFSFLCNMQHLLSSFYIHPRNEWVTWICLFAL